MKNTTTIIAIVGIALFGSIGWLLMKTSSTPVAQITTIQPTTETTGKQPAQQTAPAVQPAPTTNETADWQTYTNAPYSFTLKIPTDWNGYTTKNSMAPKEAEYTAATDFNVPKYDGVFTITVYTNDQWHKKMTDPLTVTSEEILGTNTQYTYTFGQGALLGSGGMPDDSTLAAQLQEVGAIKKTFALTK